MQWSLSELKKQLFFFFILFYMRLQVSLLGEEGVIPDHWSIYLSCQVEMRYGTCRYQFCNILFLSLHSLSRNSLALCTMQCPISLNVCGRFSMPSVSLLAVVCLSVCLSGDLCPGWVTQALLTHTVSGFLRFLLSCCGCHHQQEMLYFFVPCDFPLHRYPWQCLPSPSIILFYHKRTC